MLTEQDKAFLQQKVASGTPYSEAFSKLQSLKTKLGTATQPVIPPTADQTRQQATDKMNVGSPVAQTWEAAKGAVGQIGTGIKNFAEGQAGMYIPGAAGLLGESASGSRAKSAGGGSDVVMGLLGLLTSPISGTLQAGANSSAQVVKPVVGATEGLQTKLMGEPLITGENAGNTVSQLPSILNPVTGGMMAFNDGAKKLGVDTESEEWQEGVVKPLSAALNIMTLKLGGEKAAPGAIDELSKTGAELGKTVGDAVSAKVTDQAVQDWQKPASTNKSTYTKASEIFDNAANSTTNPHNIAETLTKDKVKLSDNVSGGSYDTSATAEKIRSDAAKASADLLRPALQVTDQSVPKTSVNTITEAAIRDIENSKGVTAGDMEAQISKVISEGKALDRKFPDGMSLTDMHDQKITYASNGKYSPVGDPGVNNIASVNRALGRILADKVETLAPPEIPVKEFNKELQKQYQAADYLDALDTKKVPKSFLSRLAQGTAKLGGAVVGEGLGGGFLSGFAGYRIGGLIESMVENMSNPAKEYFLNNLEKTNPPAFQALQDYLSQSKNSSVAMPASTTNISITKNPIPPTLPPSKK